MTRKEVFAFIVECEAWKKLFQAAEPQSREQALLVTKLDEARLWATEILALEDDIARGC